MILSSADIFFKISLFLAVAFSEMIFREYQKCAKQFGSRSFPTFCRALSGSKLFAR